MRRFRWFLICCLLLTGPRAFALEFFGDVLYWQATEPVDWTMNTNRLFNRSIGRLQDAGLPFHPGIPRGSRSRSGV